MLTSDFLKVSQKWDTLAASSFLPGIAALIIIVVAIIAFGKGFLIGLKSAIYTIIVSLAGLIVGIIVSVSTRKSIESIFIHAYKDLSSVQLTNLIKIGSTYLILGFILLFIIIGEFLYIFLRKPLKRKLKNTEKNNGHRRWLNRSMGGLIVSVSSLPFTILATSPLSAIAYNAPGTQAHRGLVKGVTFGAGESMSEITPMLHALLKLSSSNDYLEGGKLLIERLTSGSLNNIIQSVLDKNLKINIYYTKEDSSMPQSQIDQKNSQIDLFIKKTPEIIELILKTQTQREIFMSLIEGAVSKQSISPNVLAYIQTMKEQFKLTNGSFEQLTIGFNEVNGLSKIELPVFTQNQVNQIKAVLFEKFGISNKEYPEYETVSNDDSNEKIFKYIFNRLLNVLLPAKQ